MASFPSRGARTGCRRLAQRGGNRIWPRTVATGYDRAKDRHDIVAQRFGDVRIKDAKDREAKVANFEEAKKNQVDPRGK